MPLPPGTRLGPYEIVSPLGAGGMGEVYRAKDARLNRDVAIKVLPELLATDANRRERFEREAKAVAALSHPNIINVFDTGLHDPSTLRDPQGRPEQSRGATGSGQAAHPYVVMELLDGETLRERLVGGALPVRKAVEIAVQIARGLGAAHDKQIVHRDLKPENIFILRDGQVKILDFGLAREMTPNSGATETRAAITDAGVAMGTVGYMAPEQIRAQPVDGRTDLFAFGAVLFEMLSGVRAFKRETAAETMTAILKEDVPDLIGANAQIPPSLDRIARHCLEKHPAERFQSARDVAFALDALSGSRGESVTVAAASAGSTRRRWLPVTIGLAGVLVVAATYGVGRLAAPNVVTPEFTRLTFRRGPISSARLAPGSDTIVYAAAWDGPTEMYSTRPGSADSLKLPFAHADIESISAAGELAIVTNRRSLRAWSRVGTLSRAPMSGGASRDVLEDVQDADWLPDGSSLVVSHYANGRYQLEFPIGKVVYATGGWISHVRVSPDGQLVAFLDHPNLGDDRGSAAIVDRAGKVRVLSPVYESTQGLAWSPSGTEIFYTGSTQGGTRSLEVVTLAGVARSIYRAPSSLTLHDIGKDGTVLFGQSTDRRGVMGLAAGETKERDLSWLDWSILPAISDDGTAVLLAEEGDGGGPGAATYLRKMDGSPAVRLSSGDAEAISADGKWVLAMRLSPAPEQIVLLPTGAGEARLITNDAITHLQARFMPDGQRILFSGVAPGGRERTYLQDLKGGAPVPVTPDGVVGLLISPDGQWVIADRQMYPLASGAPRPIGHLDERDTIIRWTPDGRGLFVSRTLESRALEVARFDLASGARTVVRQVPSIARGGGMNWSGNLLLSADASAYVYGYRLTLSDLFLAKGLR